MLNFVGLTCSRRVPRPFCILQPDEPKCFDNPFTIWVTGGLEVGCFPNLILRNDFSFEDMIYKREISFFHLLATMLCLCPSIIVGSIKERSVRNMLLPCPSVQQRGFVAYTIKRLRPLYLSHAQATALQKQVTLLLMRLKIHRCLVNSDYWLQAEIASLIQTVFSSVSDDRLADFTQSFVFSYSRLLIKATSCYVLFLPISLRHFSVTVIIASNCMTKYFIRE